MKGAGSHTLALEEIEEKYQTNTEFCGEAKNVISSEKNAKVFIIGTSHPAGSQVQLKNFCFLALGRLLADYALHVCLDAP